MPRSETGGNTAEILRQAGLRATVPRVRVYEALRDDRGHHSVDDVIRRLKECARPVSRMSVYNVMADLEAAGLVMRADTGPGRAIYEVSEIRHHHFVCRVCKTIIDVPCAKGEKPCLDHPAGLGGIVEEAQVIFRGVCAACAHGEPPA